MVPVNPWGRSTKFTLGPIFSRGQTPWKRGWPDIGLKGQSGSRESLTEGKSVRKKREDRKGGRGVLRGRPGWSKLLLKREQKGLSLGGESWL